MAQGPGALIAVKIYNISLPKIMEGFLETWSLWTDEYIHIDSRDSNTNLYPVSIEDILTCDECGKKFSRSGLYLAHIRTRSHLGCDMTDIVSKTIKLRVRSVSIWNWCSVHPILWHPHKSYLQSEERSRNSKDDLRSSHQTLRLKSPRAVIKAQADAIRKTKSYNQVI